MSETNKEPQDQVDETSSYLNNSNLVPETNFDIPGTEQELIGESVSSIPDTTTEMHDPELAAQTKSAKAAAKKNGGLLKEHLPKVVVGVIGVAVFGLVVVGKMVNTPPQAVVTTPPAQQQAAVDASQQPASGAPGVVGAVPGQLEDPTAAIERRRQMENMVDVALYRAEQDKVREANHKVATLEATTQQLSGEISALKGDLEQTRQALLKKKAADAAPKYKDDLFSKSVPSLKQADGYGLYAVRNGLAWIDAPDGKRIHVREGDTVPGLGKVKTVDEIKHVVHAGDRLVR